VPGCFGVSRGEAVRDFGDGFVLFRIVHQISLRPGNDGVQQSA
jgi:hypothetical protein